MSQYNSREQMQKNLGMLPGESTIDFEKRSANIRNATPKAPQEQAVINPTEVKALVRSLDRQRAERIEQERAVKDSQANEVRANPYAAILNSSVSLSKRQRKHLQKQSEELIAANQRAEAERLRVQTVTTSDVYVRALGHSTALVDNVPPEYRAEAEQLASDLVTLLDIAKYYTESQSLIQRARASLDAAFQQQAETATSALAEAAKLHNTLSAVENLNTTDSEK
jgi:hypothetical protein